MTNTLKSDLRGYSRTLTDDLDLTLGSPDYELGSDTGRAAKRRRPVGLGAVVLISAAAFLAAWLGGGETRPVSIGAAPSVAECPRPGVDFAAGGPIYSSTAASAAEAALEFLLQGAGTDSEFRPDIQSVSTEQASELTTVTWAYGGNPGGTVHLRTGDSDAWEVVAAVSSRLDVRSVVQGLPESGWVPTTIEVISHGMFDGPPAVSWRGPDNVSEGAAVAQGESESFAIGENRADRRSYLLDLPVGPSRLVVRASASDGILAVTDIPVCSEQ